MVAVAAVGLALAAAAHVRAADEPARPYGFAVIPQAPPVPTRARWLPIVEAFSRASGVPLEIRLYHQMDDFNRDLAAGNVDFAWVNPVQLIRARELAGYRPLLRDDRLVRGVFVVRDDSPFDSVASLAGREVAFLAHWTFCSESLRSQTQRLGIRPRYVGTTANAYKQVLLGEVAAAGLLDVALLDAAPEIRARLRVVYQTDSMAAHALIVHPRVPALVAAQLRAAVLELARDAASRPVLAGVRLESPVDAEYQRDYAPLEQVLQGPDLRRTAEHPP
jgi:phosphonate transport system substrate-binding protein